MVVTIHAEARKAAKAKRERFYFTGQPCKRGHIAKRYTGTGLCAICATLATLRVQAKKREHPKRVAARERGEIHYSTGVPCKHGHDQRFVATGACCHCAPGYRRKYLSIRPGVEARWARERRARNPLPHRLEVLRWMKKNPGKVRKIAQAASHNYRARLMDADGIITKDEIADLRERQRNCCAGCGGRKKLELDHVVAVVNGGANTIANAQLLCRSCNATKSKRDAIVWAQSQGRLL